MSALANILLSQKKSVSGSDAKQSAISERLRERGALICYRQDGSSLRRGQTVVYSTAIKKDNLEWKACQELNLETIHRSELLERLMGEKKQLIVAGAHGKTSVTSLLSYVLEIAQLDPCYAIGGYCLSLESNGRWGQGEYFVAEGDESDGSFLKTRPFAAIVNNIDVDHLGYYWKSYEDLLEAFKKFITQVELPELCIYNADDPCLKKWAPEGISFGFSPSADIRIERLCEEGEMMQFDLIEETKVLSHVKLSMIGRHNVLNAAAVYALASRLGIQEEVIREAFQTFKGIERRMEVKSQTQNIFVIDDYAHHPREILETVIALERAFPLKRVVKVFQPHRFTRVCSLLDEFVDALAQIEENLIVTDIYSAGESSEGWITTQAFLNALEKRAEFQYVPRESLGAYLVKIATPGDIVLLMGAGDITEESRFLAEQLNKENEPIPAC